MNKKEMFLEIARFEAKGRVFMPSCFQWFMPSTIERWKKEGLRDDLFESFSFDRGHDRKTNEYFHFDRTESLPISLFDLFPPFERKVLEENERHEVIIDEDGIKKKIFKGRRVHESMDQRLEYPVKDRKSWNEYKKRVDPDSPARFPSQGEKEKENYKKANYPIGILAGSFFGWLRNWIGIENLSYMLIDDISLIEEMEEHIEYFILSILKKALKNIKVDFAVFWEDMAYKSGSLVSPSFVKKYMVPHYKEIIEFLRSQGVDIITLDSDGNVWELIPIWLECGINGVLPNEVAAGMDVVKMRKKFGQNLIMLGGIDKRVLARGKEDIKREVMSKVPYLLSSGGYFPAIDHFVPPDVPFQNYLYYLELVRKLAH